MIEKNIYQKLKSACEEAGYVKKGEKKAGMPFNPLQADDVKKVAMQSLLQNGLYPLCNYTTDIRENFVMINCDMKIVNVDKPNEFIEINGSSGFGKLDKYGTGNGMTYAQKYAFLSALNLKTGIKDESGYEPVSFEKNSVEQSSEPTYLDDEIDVEEIINRIEQTKTDKQLDSVKSQVRSVVNHLKNNNFKAYEQIRDYTRKHEVKLTNNKQQFLDN